MLSNSKFSLILTISLVFLLATGFTMFAAEEYPTEVQSWLDTVKSRFGGTTLTVSMGNHPSTDAFREMEEEFENQTNIEVQWDIIQGQKLRPNHFSQATAGNPKFDVWMVDGFYIDEYVKKQTLDPLPSYLDSDLTPSWFDYDDIIPAYKQTLSIIDETPYTIPTAGETRLMAYRTDLFEEYDIDPPDTTEELLDAARFFDEEVEGVYGMTTRAQQGIFYASGWLHVLYQFSDGWIDQDTGEVLAGNENVVESLRYWNDLLETGPPDISSYTHEEAASAFMTGDSAIWFDASAVAGWLVDPERSDVADKVSFLPPPKGPKGRYGGLAGWSIGIPKASDSKDAAWAFIVWMTSKYNATDYLEYGGVPVRTSVLNDPDVISDNPSLYEATEETLKAAKNLTDKGLKWIPGDWLANPVLKEAGTYGSKALVGDLTDKEACQKLAESLKDIMRR